MKQTRVLQCSRIMAGNWAKYYVEAYSWCALPITSRFWVLCTEWLTALLLYKAILQIDSRGAAVKSAGTGRHSNFDKKKPHLPYIWLCPSLQRGEKRAACRSLKWAEYVMAVAGNPIQVECHGEAQSYEVSLKISSIAFISLSANRGPLTPLDLSTCL